MIEPIQLGQMWFYDVQQASEEWHALRLGVPTSSEFSCIMTPVTRKLSGSVRRYIARLIGEKMSLYGPERPEAYTSNAMRHGQDTEEEARRFYCMDQSEPVTNGGFCLSYDKRFGCSPDGLVGSDGTLELKCPGHESHTAYLLDGELPAEYVCQIHGQLIVTGRKFADFLSYHPGLPPFRVRTTPDDFTDDLRVCLELFWQEYLIALQKIRGMS